MLPKIYPVTCHTDHVGPGSTFVAIKGFKEDGTKYIQKAIELGATKIVVEEGTSGSWFETAYASSPRTGEDQKSTNIENNSKLNSNCKHKTNSSPNISVRGEEATPLPSRTMNTLPHLTFVKNTRKALAELSSQALGNPASKLKIVGITGTKGKTTTSYLTEYILKQAGFKTALLGTVKNKILDEELDATNTTPEGDYLQIFFAECVKRGVEYVVMEVSSHALSLNRVHGVEFDAVGFTNLNPEHLDFYKDMDDYFQAKMEIFKQLKSGGSVVINSDNEWGRKALEILGTKNFENKILTFGQKGFSINSLVSGTQLYGSSDKPFETQTFSLLLRANGENHTVRGEEAKPSRTMNTYTLSISQNNLDHLKFKIKPDQKRADQIESSKLFGEFNAYNISMSFLICEQLGISTSKIKDAIKNFSGVPGRLQFHKLKNGAKAFVDYAHNPSSMEAVLQTLRPLTEDLIVVFGCGGDRDKTKRPVMGKIACQNANKVVITSDNPRSEEPEEILKNILAGIDQKEMAKITCELDRKKAIQKAAELSGSDSVIALLGKGHENYFLIKGQKFHLDDLEEISKF